MGGQIGLESKAGEGAIFWFELTLPITELGQAKSVPPAAAKVAGEEAAGWRVLAVRLCGNMMRGGMIVGIRLTITPFLFPVVMTLLGLLTGMVQAYIFSILAAVYLAAATRPAPQPNKPAAPAV